MPEWETGREVQPRQAERINRKDVRIPAYLREVRPPMEARSAEDPAEGAARRRRRNVADAPEAQEKPLKLKGRIRSARTRRKPDLIALLYMAAGIAFLGFGAYTVYGFWKDGISSDAVREVLLWRLVPAVALLTVGIVLGRLKRIETQTREYLVELRQGQLEKK